MTGVGGLAALTFRGPSDVLDPVLVLLRGLHLHSKQVVDKKWWENSEGLDVFRFFK